MTDRVLVAKVQFTRPDGGAETLFFSDRPLPPLPANDREYPNVRVYCRILGLPTFSSDIFADPERLSGGTGVGSLSLSNADRALDWLRGCAPGLVDLRWLWRGWRWGDGVQLLQAQGVSLSVTNLSPCRYELRLDDGRRSLDLPVRAALWGDPRGTAGPEWDQLNGDISIKGQPKPVLLGELFTGSIPCVWANKEKRIAAFCQNSGNVTISEICDGGGNAALTYDRDYTRADLLEATVAQAHYACDGGGLVRFGGGTTDALTFGAASTTDRTFWKIARLLLRKMLVSDEKIGSSFSIERSEWSLGIYNPESYGATFDMLCRSVLGYVLPNGRGIWQIGLLADPSESSATTVFGEHDIVSIDGDDPGMSCPVFSVKVRYGRIYRTMSRDELHGSVRDTPRESDLAREWRDLTESDGLTQTRWKNAREISLDTALRYEVDARALARKILSRFGRRSAGPPLSLRVAVVMNEKSLRVQLGDHVLLRAPDLTVAAEVLGIRLLSPRPDLITLRVLT